VTLAPCAGVPVSWLTLERYRLGELPGSERRAVEAHLLACAACAACLAEVERPLVLPPLPAAARASSWRSRVRRALRGAWPAQAWAAASAGGVAVVLAAVLVARPKLPDHALSGVTSPGIKGGDVAISLVRERDGAIDHDARTFTARDRWKVLVTCPSERLLFWDVIVVAGATPSFPLSPGAPIACGNHVPLPGAFHIDGSGPAQVCLVLADDPLDRARLSALAGTAALAQVPRATCVTLSP
jgi:Putative zinc-finger